METRGGRGADKDSEVLLCLTEPTSFRDTDAFFYWHALAKRIWTAGVRSSQVVLEKVGWSKAALGEMRKVDSFHRY